MTMATMTTMALTMRALTKIAVTAVFKPSFTKTIENRQHPTNISYIPIHQYTKMSQPTYIFLYGLDLQLQH